jgi:methylated-DNA-protein-cysteine methyltransferase-like protein
VDESAFSVVYDVVRSIPRGRVMSYGMVGELCGCGPRVVGWAMASVPEGVPWHRVVGADGYLRIGKRSAELQAAQRTLLREEGVSFTTDNCVDMERCRWVADALD